MVRRRSLPSVRPLSRMLCGIQCIRLTPIGTYHPPIPVLQFRRSYKRDLVSPPLSETSPELLMYWHPTKNQDITPSDVTLKSFRKVWWKCPKGVDHEWQNCVRYVVDKDGKFLGCPFCKNKRVSITNSLSTKRPEIAAQWHPTKNGSLLPSSVPYTSSKSVWWQCDKNPNHIWRRPINQRVSPKTATQGLFRESMISSALSLLLRHGAGDAQPAVAVPRDRQRMGLREERRSPPNTGVEELCRSCLVEVREGSRVDHVRQQPDIFAPQQSM